MKKILLYIISLTYLLFGQMGSAMAQSEEFGTDVLGDLVTAGGTRDLFDIIVGIVNVVLYFLGGIAVILGLYAGWLWFTSRGNAEQIRKAKAIMVSAVIGLAIIFASYAITNFVIGNLYSNILGNNETIPDDGGGGDDDGSGNICPPPADGSSMVICTHSGAKPVGGYVTITGWNFGDYIEGASQVTINSVPAPLVSCGATPQWNRRITRGTNVSYRVKAIVPDVPVGGPYEIKVQNTIAGQPQSDSRNNFYVLAGSAGLNIACFEPTAGARNTTVVAKGINFGTTGNRTIRMSGWTGLPAAVAPVDADYNPANWSDTQITFTIPNEALSSYIIIANDANTDQEFFRVSCTGSGDCQTGCCSNNSCVVCGGSNNNTGSPHINYITPDNGAENNLVTIYGSGFGTGGVVIFTDSTGATFNAQTPQEVYSSCTNFWTDNEIIIGVPEEALGAYSVTVLPSASTIASNGFTFTINNTLRPGICSATPNSGSFGTPVTITGVNFVEADGNTIKYGGEVGGSVDITVPNVAGSTVPNLRRGLVGVQINAGSEVSNPYSFAITDAIAGEPSIVNIDPIAGPAGTYLTINGTNFGSSKGSGKVVFVQGTTIIDANFSFPLECTNYIWSSSRIMVKVPSGLTADTSYEVKVIRSDSKESNTKPFTANTDTLRPGLCAMYPDNGQKMTTQVSFYGDNFGTAQGAVLFYNGQSTTTSVWNNNKALYSRVPGEAETGPVSVVNSDGLASNSLNFRVGSCSRDNNCNTEIGEKCCTNSIGNYCATSCSNVRMCSYGWDFKTVPTAPEPLSVEYKWPACDSSCGNVAIGVAFNVMVGPTAEEEDNYSIFDITDNVLVPINNVTLTQVPGANPEVDLDYEGTTLQVGHTYRVTVSTDILSLDGERLPEPEVWEFTVGQGSCAFTGAIITPANYTTREPNQKIYYKADPTASNGSCGVQRLICGDTPATACTYRWSLNNTDVADWDVRTPDGNRKRTAISTSNEIPAFDVSSVVSCTITQGSLPSVSASTDLHKDYRGYLESLIVTEYYPNCANACINTVVEVHFSSALDITTVNTSNIQVFDTSNANQNVTQTINATLNDTANPNSESVWQVTTAPLVSGHRYHVVISKNVKNVFGNSLKNVFEWYFTMGSESCVVTGATVTPSSFTAGSIGQSKKYVVQANSTTISCGRVPVNCSNCSYQWSSDSSVATLSEPQTNKDVFATVAPTATSGSSTNISCQVTQGTNNTLPLASGILNVELNTGSTLPPQIESFAPAIGSIPQCRNVAIEITFDQKMNLDSIKNNLKLYNSSNVALAGTFSFANINRTKTKVVFSPTELLVAGNEYRVAAGPGIVNIRGQALIFTNNPSLDPAAQAWKFTAGTEICEISYVRTVPSSDWFSCGGNTCEDDDHPGAQTGNQHDYVAIPYSRQGSAISDIGMTYAWRVSPNEDSVSLTNASLKTTTATAEENGRSAVSVTVTNVTSNISASASLPVTVSLCQNPWPSISNFPWNDSSFNFSTYYCQKFDDSSAALPYLNYPPVATSPTSNPDIGNKILAEYIFTVNINNTTSKNNALGSLAYYLPKSSEQKKSIWQRISALTVPKQVIGQSFPPVLPGNINVAVNGSVVTINWSQPTDWRTTENFAVQRKLNSATNWSTLTTIDVTSPGTVPSSYIDNSISTSGIYNYKIVTCNDASDCADSTPNTVTVTVSATSETNFIIFRVMPNLEHLSVSEWYKSKFPGDALGTMTTVDGYEAMRVGNTIYISAANISNNKIHTNIYIIAYSVGANAQTKSIYDQFVANFRLNTNPGFSDHNDDNLCSTADSPGVYRNCSSDLDCKSGDFCRSRSLKLRRDVKRVTDLLPVKKYLETYGISHLACSGNSQVTCTAGGNECGSLGPCVSYYPQLRSGTFVPGKSNSKWPSWQQTLATDLRQTLPLDPINRFSGCANGADPETCWNEASRIFECRQDSYIYGYVLQDTGKDYELYSNFEYDPLFYSATFSGGLNNGNTTGLSAVGNISTNLSNYCSISANLPGTSLCGNGRVDFDAGETCDGGINYAQCSTLGDHPWWNDQVSGCNPPGTPNECRWYAPVLTPAMCGGYCGDGTLQTSYENCDANRYNGSFSCPSNGAVSCNNTSCNAVCADGLPAAKCGDGVLTSGREACDASASPNGLAIWDCPNNGNVRCTSCGIVCDNDETPYIGRCGDGTVQAPGELCDYANYPAQTPATADGSPLRYTCSLGCNFTAQPYCGDGILQQGNGELCDNYLLASTTPAQSSPEKQYQCRMTNDIATNPDYTRCTPTIGGYCGDGIVQNGTGGTVAAGEKCDPLGYVVDDTNPSSVTHQYVCTTACQTTGGYCGDGVYNSTKEECDASAGTPNGLSGWSCTLDGNVSCNNLCKRTCNVGTLYAGQCGNEIVETPEQCDGSGVACRDINSNLYVGGYTACNANSCSVESTGSCCTTNNLSAKFMVDNSFQLFVNGLIIGTGQDWQTCVNGLDTAYDAANLDDRGACEFNINDTNLFNYNHAENVVAFTAQDTGVAAGVVGTFSCQNKSCKSVCYQGSDAGKICSSNSDCASGFCARPSTTATSCTWNNDCGTPTLTNGTTVPTVSLCLPDDYGITTKVNNSLWRCTDVPPSGEAWKSTGFTEDTTWKSPEAVPPASSVVNWWGDNQQYNWKHMVPGAEPIWLGGVGSPTSPRTIYCRYVIQGYNSSLPTPDLENPSVPASLQAASSGSQISLTWQSSTDNVQVTGYNILRSITNGSGYVQVGTSNTNSYVDSGLQNRTYYYVVQAYDANGNTSANSAQAFATVDNAVPSTPASLTASVVGTTISLSWPASTDNIGVTGYNIFRHTVSGGPYTKITTSVATSYTESLALGTYYYVVQAYDAAGNTSGNSPQAVAIMDVQAPSVPSNIQAASANARVNLSWNASTDPEGSVVTYIVERALAVSGPFAPLATVGTLSHSDTGLTNGTEYFYRIKARDTSNNQSAYSTPVVSAIPDNSAVAPNAPTALSIAVDAVNRIMNLNWTFSAPGPLVAYYLIERSVSATFDTFSAVGTTLSNTFADNFAGSPAQVAVRYYYRVVAVGTAGLRSAAASISALFPDDIAPAPAPSAVSGSFAGTHIALTWTASNDNIGVTQYLIERGTNVSGPFAQIGTSPSTSYNNTGFLPNATYYYQVRAQDAAGNTSAYSAPPVMVVARDNIAPSPAPVLSGIYTDPEITLSWTGSSDNIGVTQYLIERAPDLSGPYVQIATSPTSPYSNTSFIPGATYHYQVRAQDAAGNNSAYSNRVSVVASDTTAPSVPSGAYVEGSGYYDIRLMWAASTDNVGVTGYVVERSESPSSGFAQIATVAAPAYNGTFTASDFNKTFYYRFAARDAAGNQSAFSNPPIMHQTLDTIIPTTPTNLQVVGGAAQMNLNWTASTDARGINHYNIERSSTGVSGSFSFLATSLTNSYVDSSATTGTFYYRISAVDNSNLPSSYSSTASGTITGVVPPSTVTISSVNDTSITHSQAITISGSGFGSKATVSPLNYDTMESGSFSTAWEDTHALTIGSDPANRRHANSTYYGTNNFQNNLLQGAGFFTGSNSQLRDTWYARYWFKLDNNWDWGTTGYPNLTDASLANVKFFRLWNPGSTAEDFVMATQGYSGGGLIHEGSNIPGTVGYFGSQNDWTKGTWHVFDFAFKENSDLGVSDGVIKMWFDGKKILDKTNLVTRGTFSGLKRPLILGFYNSWWDSGSNSDRDDFYIDDAYIDGTWSRVMICDQSVWNDSVSRHCEIQAPQSTWNSSSIQISANTGSFTSGQTAYLYVIDNNGNVNSSGYPITITNSVAVAANEEQGTGLVMATMSNSLPRAMSVFTPFRSATIVSYVMELFGFDF